MRPLKTRIANLEYNIRNAKQALQYAPADDRARELREIARMEETLLALEKQLNQEANNAGTKS